MTFGGCVVKKMELSTFEEEEWYQHTTFYSCTVCQGTCCDEFWWVWNVI